MKNFSFKFKILIGVIVIAGGFLVWRIFFDKGVVSVFFTPSEFEQQFDIVLKDYNGNDVNLLEYKDKPLIVYSWASWCSFCKDDIPTLVEMQKELGDKITIIAINRAEPFPTAKDYLNSLGVEENSLIFIFDPGDSFYKLIGGFSVPEAILVDGKGNISDHERGPIDLNKVKEKIRMESATGQ